ncbi:MAG TPA: type 1 glutamine amidotransferase [Mycobacteriales bacterium]|jgi:GMP synthase-like glutamine amidotransferase|nr:type 1 glutamine amidotransferase [Mycobacteriales bacterium]
MPRALAISHITPDGLGTLDEWLPAAGLDLDVVRAEAGERIPTALPPRYHALIVMGGGQNVDEQHDWLPRELELVERCVSQGVPTLGICLGAQVMALACGGSVGKGAAGPELGAGRVYLRRSAAADPLFAGMPMIVDTVQWHWYGIDHLPPGAVWLAGSPAYPYQAFRLGDRAWGVQFHPETPPHQVDRWTDEDANAIRAQHLVVGEVRKAGIAAARAGEVTWRPFFERFAALVAQTAQR